VTGIYGAIRLSSDALQAVIGENSIALWLGECLSGSDLFEIGFAMTAG
jgi:hypothetical protein